MFKFYLFGHKYTRAFLKNLEGTPTTDVAEAIHFHTPADAYQAGRFVFTPCQHLWCVYEVEFIPETSVFGEPVQLEFSPETQEVA